VTVVAMTKLVQRAPAVAVANVVPDALAGQE
jgi:hypothetical protein